MNRCKATSVITLIPEPSSFIPHPSLLDPKFFAVPDDQTTNRCSKWLISDCSKKLCWWVHKGQRLIPTLKCQKVCKTHNTCSYCYCLVTNSQTGCLNILPPSPQNIFIFFCKRVARYNCLTHKTFSVSNICSTCLSDCFIK